MSFTLFWKYLKQKKEHFQNVHEARIPIRFNTGEDIIKKGILAKFFLRLLMQKL